MLKILNIFNNFNQNIAEYSLTPSFTKKLRKNKFKYGICSIPHPDKVQKGGEDAHYANDSLLAIADGVGGWASMNIDPALYSKELCRNIEQLHLSNPKKYEKNPKKLLEDSADITMSTGSSTCCILSINEIFPILYSSYIGDSGFLILRKQSKHYQIVYRFAEHCRSFNFPYQIGSSGDEPNMALFHEHHIENNDIIIAGSDGLFDNLDDEKIVNCILPFVVNGDKIADVNLIAEALAESAFQISVDPKTDSKFALNAKKNNIKFRGGKRDDITVIVAQIELIN